MTEKRAYAVVRVADWPIGWMLMCEHADGLKDAGFQPGDEVEIRLRVAQGEEWKSPHFGLTLPDVLTEAAEIALRDHAFTMTRDLRAAAVHFRALAAAPEEPVLGGNPRNHLLGCAYKNKPSLGVAACDCGAYSPPAAHEEQGAPRGWAFDGAHSGGSATHATDTTAPPTDAQLESQEAFDAAKAKLAAALPEEVICDRYSNPHRQDSHVDHHGVACVNPRPAHPPAARTDEVVCEHPRHPTVPHPPRTIGGFKCVDPAPVSAAPAPLPTVDDQPVNLASQYVRHIDLGADGWVQIRSSGRTARDRAAAIANAMEASAAAPVEPPQDHFNNVTVSYSPAPPSPETTFKRQPNGMLTATPPDNAAAFAASHARSATHEPEKLGEVQRLRDENARFLGCIAAVWCPSCTRRVWLEGAAHGRTQTLVAHIRRVGPRSRCGASGKTVAEALRAAPTTKVGED